MNYGNADPRKSSIAISEPGNLSLKVDIKKRQKVSFRSINN